MATIAGLTYPTMVEHNGMSYVTGYREGGIYVRRSGDGGRSWLPYSDGSEERLVCEPADEARAGLLKTRGQGRRLMAAVSVGGEVRVFMSADDGETWTADM